MDANGTRNVDLARTLNVSKSAVTNWLNGSNSIDIDKVPLICDFFGIDIDAFLGQSTSTPLDETEIRLINAYRLMNDDGKRALAACASGLLSDFSNRRAVPE